MRPNKKEKTYKTRFFGLLWGGERGSDFYNLDDIYKHCCWALEYAQLCHVYKDKKLITIYMKKADGRIVVKPNVKYDIEWYKKTRALGLL